ncbi:hypothetical protein ACFT2C_04390 [Promicromonospora sp. NPDC057138]|uniref:hypothetical protein n=1 Tax=Promicromonospora sp. NPDC057138 TaxID=3346031 RepID=UPI003642EB44
MRLRAAFVEQVAGYGRRGLGGYEDELRLKPTDRIDDLADGECLTVIRQHLS